MSDSLYAKFNAVLIGILARLDVIEETLKRLDRSGNKKAIHVSLPEQPNFK